MRCDTESRRAVRSAPAALAALATHHRSDVRAAVAANPSTAAADLELLAADTDPGVRSGVAINPSAGGGLLEQLSSDPSSLVRSCAAQNPATPAAALAGLAGDADSRVRLAALANPSTPAGSAPGEAAAAASHPDPGHSAARNVTALTEEASDPATTGDVLDALDADRDAAVRFAVAVNPTTAPATLLTLTVDTRPDVADAARAALAAVLAAAAPQPAAP